MLNEGDEKAFVLKFDGQGEQAPLSVENAANCTGIFHSHMSKCEGGFSKDSKLADLLGLSENDWQGTAFRPFRVQALVFQGGACSGIFPDEIMDCCDVRSKC